MSELTCKDCKHWSKENKNGNLGYCFVFRIVKSNDCICSCFETTDGKRPRFCRLASSVDEMAEALIEEALNRRGSTGYYFVKDPSSFCSDRAKVKRKVMKWLMEVEE